MVLFYRAMVRVGAYSPSSVTLRVFVDDSGIQWKGLHLDGVRELQEAMDAWQEGVDEVELFNAVEKEALLVSHPGLLTKLRGFQSAKRRVYKKWHCYVGFDIFSGSVSRAPRKTPANRLAKSSARKEKVKGLAKVVKGRIRKILSAGIRPQCLHNAQVVGATETELEKTVTMPGQMLGVKQRMSTHTALL